MNEISLGNLIRKERESQGLSQEQLCEGICDIRTISRLENGQTIPAAHRLRAILQKLGLPEERVYARVSDGELRFSALEKELNDLHIRYERAGNHDRAEIRAKAKEIYEELSTLTEGKDRIAQQLILRSKYLLGTEEGPYSLEEGLDILLRAIRLTSPKFAPDYIGKGFYTETEVKLINSIAVLYLRNGKHHDAIDVLKQLLKYLQTHTRRVAPDRAHIPLVALNYARELCAVTRYVEAIEIAEYARRICIDHGYLLFLPDLFAVLAECHYFRGEQKESRYYYRLAFAFYEGIEDCRSKKTIQTEAKERLGLDLKMAEE